MLRITFAVVSLTLLCGGCSSLPSGRNWGETATLTPGWAEVGSAASEAARDPWVWAPLLGAAVFQIDDWDRRTSDWAREHTPVFGSQREAEEWSDELKDASALVHYASIALMPGLNTYGTLNALLLALREIRRNVLRSSLTILGIVIGVASVITMVTIGEGATAQVQADMQKLGTNLLQVFRGQGFGGGGARSASPPFTLDDARAIEQEIAGIRAVAPASNTGAQAIYGNSNWSTQIVGTSDKYLDVRDWLLANGRNFSESELRSGAAVCILGDTVKQELFGSQDPLGANIRLQKVSCQVIGTLVPKGQSGFGQNQDDVVLVPLRMLQRRLVGNSDVNSIMVSARDTASTEKVQRDIERLLRERRKIRDGATDDFNVRDLQEITSAFTNSSRVMTALLSAVAAVSLVVGGVGIMNIMLVSVTERTREIGTRLAVGAMAKDVLLQFLVEAVTLAAFGGIIGIVLGLTAGILANNAFNVPYVFNPGIILISFAFSAAVGIVFGYFPARRAAQLDPIEALRHE